MPRKTAAVAKATSTKRTPPPPLPEEELEDSPVETPSPSAEAPAKKRTPRKKATIEDHIAHYDELIELLQTEIDRRSREKKDGIKPLRSARKMVIKMRKELPQVTRSRAARAAASQRRAPSGLMVQYKISPELATFLKLEPTATLSRIEATRAICVYSHIKEGELREEILRWGHLNPDGKRNLQNPHDKKTILPDQKLSKLLRYDAYKKSVAAGQVVQKNGVVVSNPALYYFTIQKLLNHHFIEAV